MDSTAVQEVLNNLAKIHAKTGVPPWVMMLISVVMFGAWTWCYAAIIWRCYKQKTYGIPIVNSCLNVCWELIFSFNMAGHLSKGIEWGNRFWLIPDSLNVMQIFLYGKQVQKHPWMKDNFYAIVISTLILCGVGDYLFIVYFNDVYGVTCSLILDILMSVLFINMYLGRPDLRGMPLSSAWLRMIGNAAGFVFLYIWWPAQFTNHQLTTEFAGKPITIPEPVSYSFCYFMYILTPIVDGLFVYLVWKRTKELAREAQTPQQA